ncbi:transcription factor LBX2-like [Phascolarctos cinereus]|uniref:Homeobox protein B-H1-like n=1 Tax=Phascolarctos cinereus TaxID=38626 RepID=A0A6P5LIW0_PHACI|nr:homeobox protein B-H1-like [Phascolarctos cinereus]
MEASNEQKRMKVQHKFSNYQLGILKENFHRNKYISPDEVHFLSGVLSLTPQQIQHWYRNQRSKRTKYAGSLKGASDIQAADGIPARSMNNSTPWKMFQNLEGLDGLRGGDVISNPEESDFLSQTPALSRSKNEDEEKKAEDIEASDNQKGKKVRHKLSGYQLQTLLEYFHRNEYIRPDEVQILSMSLDLTPQQIRFWFGNQRAKKKKFEGSFN